MDRSSIVFLGLMGAGKSSVGRAVAEHYGLPFVDLDERIVAEQGRSIPEIFAADGADAFRTIEADVLADLCESHETPMVLSTGGGTPLRPKNWERLKDLGRTVWLDIQPETAAARAQDGSRPLLREVDPLEKMRHLHAVRAPVYARAEIRIDAEQPLAEVIDGVIAALDGGRDA